MPEIKCNGHTLNICYDANGNIYLMDNSDTYLIFIGANDVLTLLKINIQNHDTNITTGRGRINNYNSKYQLKTKIIDDIIEDADDEEIENEDEHDVIRNYLYKPEDKYYEVDKANDSDNSDDVYDEPYFKFFGLCDNAQIKMDISVYDTIILSGGLSSHHVTFKSELINDTQSYRISIYTDGYVKLNVIGSIIKTYRLTKTDDVKLMPMNESIVVSKY